MESIKYSILNKKFKMNDILNSNEKKFYAGDILTGRRIFLPVRS